MTILVLTPLVLAVIWFGSLPYFFFIFGVCLLCLWEYGDISERGGYPTQRGNLLLGGVFILLSLYFDGLLMWGPIHKFPSPYFVFGVFVFLVFLREFIRRDKGHSYLRTLTTLMGVFLCAFLLGHLLLVRDLRWVAGEGFQFIGRELTFFLFVIIWSVDIGAWLVGKTVGRKLLAPRISPKKTLEGFLGGLLAGTLVGWFFREAFLKSCLGPLEAILFAVIISIVAQMSDLIESLMKRSFQVKNSSEILPGHGGILDRFDSFIFSAPFFYYLLLGTGRFQ